MHTKRLLTAAAMVVAAAAPTPAVAARHYTVSSTCYDLSGRMANGHYVHWGAVANNFLPLGTWIRMDHKVRGRRWFRVEDRIGYGTQLDIWMPSYSDCAWWGRRTVGFTVHRHR